MRTRAWGAVGLALLAGTACNAFAPASLGLRLRPAAAVSPAPAVSALGRYVHARSGCLESPHCRQPRAAPVLIRHCLVARAVCGSIRGGMGLERSSRRWWRFRTLKVRPAYVTWSRLMASGITSYPSVYTTHLSLRQSPALSHLSVDSPIAGSIQISLRSSPAPGCTSLHSLAPCLACSPACVMAGDACVCVVDTCTDACIHGHACAYADECAYASAFVACSIFA